MNLPVPIDHLPVVRPEVLVGEIVSPGVVHELCGEFHEYAGGDLFICCACGHAHRDYEACRPDRACGCYLCCRY